MVAEFFFPLTNQPHSPFFFTFSGHLRITRRLWTLAEIQAHFPCLLTHSNHVTTSIHSGKKHLPKVWMPCILVIISVRPRERVHNAFYPRRATKVVSRSIRKRPCCQQSVGCSKELLKIREIQPPRKSTSVAYLFDNVYNRNVRDVDKYLHVYCLNQYLFL